MSLDVAIAIVEIGPCFIHGLWVYDAQIFWFRKLSNWCHEASLSNNS